MTVWRDKATKTVEIRIGETPDENVAAKPGNNRGKSLLWLAGPLRGLHRGPGIACKRVAPCGYNHGMVIEGCHRRQRRDHRSAADRARLPCPPRHFASGLAPRAARGVYVAARAHHEPAHPRGASVRRHSARAWAPGSSSSPSMGADWPARACPTGPEGLLAPGLPQVTTRHDSLPLRRTRASSTTSGITWRRCSAPPGP